MRDSIIDAIFETDSAKGKLANAARGEDARAEKLIRPSNQLSGASACCWLVSSPVRRRAGSRRSGGASAEPGCSAAVSTAHAYGLAVC
jgi:hypothetical protein